MIFQIVDIIGSHVQADILFYLAIAGTWNTTLHISCKNSSPVCTELKILHSLAPPKD